MTTITINRATAQQALEVLESGLLVSHHAQVLIDLRAALAQQAEPEEQMPVGWLESPHGAFRADPLYKMQFPSQILQWQIALYAAPPQRKPLTDEEIERIARDCLDAWSCTRAVEAAHGIKVVEEGK